MTTPRLIEVQIVSAEWDRRPEWDVLATWQDERGLYGNVRSFATLEDARLDAAILSRNLSRNARRVA